MSAKSNGPIRSPHSSDPDGKSSSAREFRSQLEAIANTPSPLNRTSEWVSGIDDASGQHSTSYMERLCRGVRSLFLEVLQTLLLEKQEPEEVTNSVRRSYETIVIWDDDFGASSGGLDETFQKSPEIRNLTAEIMREVAEILIEVSTFGLSVSIFRFAERARNLQDLMDSARFMESHGYNWDEDNKRRLPPPPRNPRDILEKTKSLTAATECLSSLAPLYEEPPVQFVPYETERLASEANKHRGGFYSLKLTIDRHHIVTDLKPYICIAPSCYGERVVPFENCQSWESHLLAKHSDDWKLESCPLCHQETAGMDRPAITKHIRHHLKEVALASMPIGTDPGLDDGSQQDSASNEEDDAAPLSCPFRKRNPQRFNVDRWPSCALGSFENILMLKYKSFRLLFELHVDGIPD
ncbi:hypothetical protein ACKVWE_003476 [Pyricularia oryzae]